MPKVTSKCWVLLDARENEVMWSKNMNKRSEVASLTKIMTLYVTCEIMEYLEIKPKELLLEVSEVSGTMEGTTASLKPYD
jgi:serine-type D-Ala-D-Ala carboxypeptidase (penicillin-binding protein 5/6)